MEVNGFEIAVFQNSVVQPLQCTRHLGDKHFVEVLCYTYPCSQHALTWMLLIHCWIIIIIRTAVLNRRGLTLLSRPRLSPFITVWHHLLTRLQWWTWLPPLSGLYLRRLAVVVVDVVGGWCGCPGCRGRTDWPVRGETIWKDRHKKYNGQV